MAPSNCKIITVSPEMTTFLGPIRLEDVTPYVDAMAMAFQLKRDAAQPSVRIIPLPTPVRIVELCQSSDFVLLVVREAVERLFSWAPHSGDEALFHLSHPLSSIAHDLVKDGRGGESIVPYRLAKSIELLCETVSALDGDLLVPVVADCGLTERDTRAIVSARQIIDSQWSEKLTLDAIARACGINRAKLTKGFRDLYSQTIGEALAQRRLAEARSKLLTTDMPVSSIGYASGYLNNASFTRAFGRHFGQSPSDCRAMRLAA